MTLPVEVWLGVGNIIFALIETISFSAVSLVLALT